MVVVVVVVVVIRMKILVMMMILTTMRRQDSGNIWCSLGVMWNPACVNKREFGKTKEDFVEIDSFSN